MKTAEYTWVVKGREGFTILMCIGYRIVLLKIILYKPLTLGSAFGKLRVVQDPIQEAPVEGDITSEVWGHGLLGVSFSEIPLLIDCTRQLQKFNEKLTARKSNCRLIETQCPNRFVTGY